MPGVFGASWRGDRVATAAAFERGAAAALIAKNCQLVKVNVGRFDRNRDLAVYCGVPLKKGIPAVAVLSPEGLGLHAMRGGGFEGARDTSDTGLYDHSLIAVPTRRPAPPTLLGRRPPVRSLVGTS